MGAHLATMGMMLAGAWLAGAESSPPPLPPGLNDTPASAVAPGPTGLESWSGSERLSPIAWEIRAGLDGRYGGRLHEDANHDTSTLGEIRGHIEIDTGFPGLGFLASVDLLGDFIEEDHQIDLEKGEGWLDVRELYVTARLSPWVDAKLGRQLITWGTGDLIYINDRFPKDQVSFVIGRDEAYIKAPSDAFRLGFFTDVVHVDLVYAPRFDPDRFADGSRLSFRNPFTGQPVGASSPLAVDRPDEYFEDDAFAGRVHRTIRGLEAAAYFYDGRWNSPAGFDPDSGQATFPRLAVYGGSLRGSLAGAILYLEVGYFDSRDDNDGTDPLVANSEVRTLLGARRDVSGNRSITLQYSVESMLRHDAYVRSLPPTARREEEHRHVTMLRLSQDLWQQDVTATLIAFYSPSDADVYVRPSVDLRLTDRWKMTVGANLFAGSDAATDFAQFEDSSNAFVGLRVSY